MAGPKPCDERSLTITEFVKLPKEDAYRVELVRGLLVRSPRPGSMHGVLAASIGYRLSAWVEAGNPGAVVADAGVVLARDPDTIRGPDVTYFTPERIPEAGYATPFWGAPDLAVEIASPSNSAPDLEAKTREYLAAGVRTVWVVDPADRIIRVYTPDGGVRSCGSDDTLNGGDVLPGFQLRPGLLFVL